MYSWINRAFGYSTRKSPFLVQTPLIPNIGNCAEEMFFGLLKAKREGKKVLFLFLLHPLFWKFALPIANKELLRVESEYIVPNESWYGRLGGWPLTVFYSLIRVSYVVWCSVKLRRIIRIIWPGLPVVAPTNWHYIMPSIGRSTLWQPPGVEHFSWDTVEKYRWREQFEEYRPPRLRADQIKEGEQLRLQMGVASTDWFVCLHVRESGNSKDSAARDASIQNYVKGIEAITAAGGWVVRLGDPSMTPLPKIERVIDYAHTQYKSELMDMYLLSQCRFYVGTNSGPFDVVTLFSKPMVLVNTIEWSLALPAKRGDLAIIKHTFSRSRNRYLSIKEILEEPFSCQVFRPPSDEYIKVENTSEEIRDVIEEFLAEPEDYEYSALQDAFNEGRRRQIHRWLDQGEPFSPGPSKKDLIIEQYRIASRADSVAGTLGHKYLEQNWTSDSLAKFSDRPLVG